MIDINKTNFHQYEDLIAEIVNWLDERGYVDWENGKISEEYYDERLAIADDMYRKFSKFTILTYDDFLDFLENANEYAAIVNDLSIDEAFEK